MKGFLERDIICTSLPLIASEGSVVLLSKHLENVFCYFTEETTTTLLLCTDSALIVSPGSVVVLLAAVPVFTLLLHCILCYYFTPLHYLKAPSSCCLPRYLHLHCYCTSLKLIQMHSYFSFALILQFCRSTCIHTITRRVGGVGAGERKKEGNTIHLRSQSLSLSVYLSVSPQPPFSCPCLPLCISTSLPRLPPSPVLPSLPSLPSLLGPPCLSFPDESGPTHVLTMS